MVIFFSFRSLAVHVCHALVISNFATDERIRATGNLALRFAIYYPISVFENFNDILFSIVVIGSDAVENEAIIIRIHSINANAEVH